MSRCAGCGLPLHTEAGGAAHAGDGEYAADYVCPDSSDGAHHFR